MNRGRGRMISFSIKNTKMCFCKHWVKALSEKAIKNISAVWLTDTSIESAKLKKLSRHLVKVLAWQEKAKTLNLIK
jgi:hypothetical protein